MKIDAWWVAVVMFCMTSAEFLGISSSNPLFSLAVQFVGTVMMFLPAVITEIKDFL